MNAPANIKADTATPLHAEVVRTPLIITADKAAELLAMSKALRESELQELAYANLYAYYRAQSLNFGDYTISRRMERLCCGEWDANRDFYLDEANQAFATASVKVAA